MGPWRHESVHPWDLGAEGPWPLGGAALRARGLTALRAAKRGEDSSSDCLGIVGSADLVAKEGNGCGPKRGFEKGVPLLARGLLVASVIKLDAAGNAKALRVRENEVEVLLRDGSAKASVPVALRAADHVRDAHLRADVKMRVKGGAQRKEELPLGVRGEEDLRGVGKRIERERGCPAARWKAWGHWLSIYTLQGEFRKTQCLTSRAGWIHNIVLEVG